MSWIFVAKGGPFVNTAEYRVPHVPLRHEATAEIWQEAFLSAILRSILYSDDPTYWLEAYRRLDPITTPEGELRFLQAAEALFPKGNLSRIVRHRHCRN